MTDAATAGLPSTRGAGAEATRARPMPPTYDDRFTTVETTPTTARNAAPVREPEPKAPKDPAPHLPKPSKGERWLCADYGFAASLIATVDPDIVLTRETPRNEAEGRGKVAVAGVVHETVFRVVGVNRRWDWNGGKDAILIKPGGLTAYYDFRGLGPLEKTKPGGVLSCVQG